MSILLFPLMSLKACHPLPVSRVRSGTGRAAFPLRPGVVESVRQSLAAIKNWRLRYSTVGLTRDRTR